MTGVPVGLGSGALVTLNANGTLTYDPNAKELLGLGFRDLRADVARLDSSVQSR